MSPSTTRSPAAAVVAAVLAARILLCPAPVAAQQDSAMMAHDSSMMSHDSSMMSHDSAMMDHGQMMGQDKMAGDNMMFMGAGDQKASGDYQLIEANGKHQLKLTDNFVVAPAPDLHLVLATGSAPGKDALDLGKVSRTPAGQTFDLPKGKDLSKYTTLLVWSKKEKRVVASADWHAPAGKMEHM